MNDYFTQISEAKTLLNAGNNDGALQSLQSYISKEKIDNIITTNEVDLLKLLTRNYNVGDNFNLIDLIAISYDEFSRQNILLPYEMRECIEKFIINKRTLIQNTTDVNNVDKISQICVMINQVRTKYRNHEKKFSIIKDILLKIQSIRKRYSRTTNDSIKLPFVEIEFYLKSYLTNPLYQNATFNFRDIMIYLNTFELGLRQFKENKYHGKDYQQLLTDYDMLICIYSTTRIEWTITTLITNITDIHSNLDDSGKIIYLKYILKNIFVFEKQFKSNIAYLNQLSFYITLYINAVENNSNFSPMTLCILNYNKLEHYLQHFKRYLENLNLKLNGFLLRGTLRLKLPELESINIELLTDYKDLRLYFLLEKMLSYLKSVKPKEKNDNKNVWILNIERTIQVIGECLYQLNSHCEYEIVKGVLSSTTDFFKSIRHNLSHYPQFLQRYNDNGYNLFSTKVFIKIQKELNFLTKFINGLLLFKIHDILNRKLNAINEDNNFLSLLAFQTFIKSQFDIFITNSNLLRCNIRQELIEKLEKLRDNLKFEETENARFDELKKEDVLEVLIADSIKDLTFSSLLPICNVLELMTTDFEKQTARLESCKSLVTLLYNRFNVANNKYEIYKPIDELYKLTLYGSIQQYFEIFKTSEMCNKVKSLEHVFSISTVLDSNVFTKNANYGNIFQSVLCKLDEVDLKDKFEIISCFLKSCPEYKSIIYQDKIDSVIKIIFETEKKKILKKLKAIMMIFNINGNGTAGIVVNINENGLIDSNILKNAFELKILECNEILHNLSLLPKDMFFFDQYCPMLIGRDCRNYIVHGSVLLDLIVKDNFIAFHIIYEHYFHNIEDIFELQAYSTTDYNLELLKNRFDYEIDNKIQIYTPLNFLLQTQ